jgi:uncharacterized protein YbbC (DUF1343 family)
MRAVHRALGFVGVACVLLAAMGASRGVAPREDGRRASAASRPTVRVRSRASAPRPATPAQRPSTVLPGIDVLFADSARLVAGRRVGLITNAAAVDRAGIPTIDRFVLSSSARLVALFAPEHGIRGTAVPGEVVTDTVDSATGIPIYSLYGPRRGAPAPEHLREIDVLVVDLQDSGTRTWTYVNTMVRSMRAARDAGKPIVVLDRPDPIGCAVQGPVLDTAFATAIGVLPVPLRHGMTMGELARMANDVLRIGADLHVVPVQGWRRCDWLDATGLPFVRPSPNLPDLEALAWYPGTVLFEATNLSVGRGTDAPFRQVGAPWLDGPRVARLMRERYGIAMEPWAFTPRDPGDAKYADTLLGGVRFPRADRAHGDPIRDALRLLSVIGEVHPAELRVDSLGVARRLGVRARAGKTSWPAEVGAFLRRRRPYLLYQ